MRCKRQLRSSTSCAPVGACSATKTLSKALLAGYKAASALVDSSGMPGRAFFSKLRCRFDLTMALVTRHVMERLMEFDNPSFYLFLLTGAPAQVTKHSSRSNSTMAPSCPGIDYYRWPSLDCLLFTSDAAYDPLCVGPGLRRVIQETHTVKP